MLLLLLTASLTFQIPLAGTLTPSQSQAIEALSAVETFDMVGDELSLRIRPGRALSVSQMETLLPDQFDRERLPITAQTIIEIEAGQCFNCTERPLREGLLREDWVSSFSVVDYAPRGRMRVRITPASPARLSALGPLKISDVLLTDRYDGVDRVDLDWPTGGVAWRSDEVAAHREALRTRRPLLLFPSAGT